MSKIERLIEFTRFYIDFQHTLRKVKVVGEDRYENNPEHSFQVAMTCWYLISEFDIEMDLSLVLKYALIHDILEVFTGDYFFIVDSQMARKKEEEEEKAIDKLIERFPNLLEIKELIIKYNSKSDKEARFVNAVEKILPVINIYLDGGRTWKDEDMDWDSLISNKDRKVSISEFPLELWNEFKPILEKSGLLRRE